MRGKVLLLLGMSFVFAVNAYASRPLEKFGMGFGKVSVDVSLGEKVDVGNVSESSNGKLGGDIAVALNKNIALQYRHRSSDCVRDYGIGKLDGGLDRDDLLLVFNALPVDDKGVGINLYGGLKRVSMSLDGNLLGNPVSRKISRNGGIVGASFVADLHKFGSAWLDVHYAKSLQGFEVGISKSIVPSLDWDLSYFYDKYKYSSYGLTDKGWHTGITWKFRMSDKSKRDVERTKATLPVVKVDNALDGNVEGGLPIVREEDVVRAVSAKKTVSPVVTQSYEEYLDMQEAGRRYNMAIDE